MEKDTKESQLSVEQKIQDRDQSTALSWLWCFLFGPLWFLFIGAYKWALIALIGNIATFGLAIFVMPFFAYRAHREVAIAKIKDEVQVSASL